MNCAPNCRCCFGKFGGCFWLSQAPMVSPAPAFGRWPLNRHQSNILPVPCWDQKRHPILAKSTNLETAGLNILWYTHTYHCTSSTAQGGGGSFKNRKPIGEVGCCESGMAERSHWWTERCLISLTLSISFSDYLPTYLPTYLSIYLSLSPSIDLLLL